ncbi:LLM class F420-dependent oxidoreductase [Mycolicibacterium diernhoferi]|uniref:LLM class F420-dependent oxidoreductase n=1 Tax=Mycolicibacterium diernhoferi TaxID=1801 RepID=A0A1Q4HD67_9MYCO|nr:LLM class F420-dependent oxidoreductase [Mycolicibacterium diernhoferi]OJZ65382.1 LLM class F420-dependent oxidoreductase [Mycolicibacterium diernhoferi]OPE53992.1 LLM class F420-dependent oxidoreductase [Mycolicibacterium diernhoferi]PEG51129.1 LLM class F420-dependent oxidoreductase [Mycolicibacterium diernhoferi]QYL22113.1 LLM class F420-dependent oxidoreductase [Mycolicibacterium diernhoferi]
MSTGIVLFPNRQADNYVDDAIAQARRAHDVGVRQIWLAQQFDHDAIGLAGLIGAAVPGLGVGTSVVPLNPRHPLVIAGQAQTAQAAAHGNFSLGIGLGSHKPEEVAFGTSWPRPVARLREYLQVLRSIFDDGEVDFHGAEFTAGPQWPVSVPGGTPIPLYVAAMGPKALQVTGELADGTLPYLAGPRTIGDFIVPTITGAAAVAGRPEPATIAFVPALVTDDVAAGREVAAQALEFYASIPSYQRVIEREGLDSPADLAAVGDAETVRKHLRRYLDAGATDVAISPLDHSQPALSLLWEVTAAL